MKSMCRKAGFFVDCDLTDKKMQKKVRESQLAQYNYILVRPGGQSRWRPQMNASKLSHPLAMGC